MRLILPLIAALALTAAATVSFVRSEEGATVRSGSIVVSGAWARATPPGATVGAAYATVLNAGQTDDRLISVESSASAEPSLHETIGGDVAQMRALPDGLEIPAGGTLAMAPGGLHIMLGGLAAPLKAGGQIDLTLVFEAAGDVMLKAPIAPAGAPGPGRDGGAGHDAGHGHGAH